MPFIRSLSFLFLIGLFFGFEILDLGMNYRQKKSHYEYHPLPRDQAEPDEKETMKALPQVSREKLEKLYDDGTLKVGDLDHKSIVTLQQLTESLQLKVIEYLEVERLFLANSRSKAGFLVSACDKAKKGELDARGFGALDPWRPQMIAECTPRPKINLTRESDWLGNFPDGHVIQITITSENNSSVSVPVDLAQGVSLTKDSVYRAIPDPQFSRSRLKLVHPIYGSLRDDRTLAYYNIGDKDSLGVKIKKRGGKKVNRQFS